MINFPRTGYRSENITTDITLGLTDGLDMSLWCYVYATIIFAGALSVFLPVGILIALLGRILVSLSVTIMSKEPIHVVHMDDQEVVIFGSISLLMSGAMGDMVTTSQGLATLLAIISITTLVFSISSYLVGQFKLSQLFDLLPFPVICGFMASIGWMLLDAGMEVATDVYITTSLMNDLEEGNRLSRLLLILACGIGLMWALEKFQKFWTFPAILFLYVSAYYLVVNSIGMSQTEQLAGGWLFPIVTSEGNALDMLKVLSFDAIQWPLIISVIPLMLTIVFLNILNASMTVTTLKANSSENLSIAHEFKVLGASNLSCAAIGSPSVYTDVVTTSLYRSIGASSRWLQITSCIVGVIVIIFGSLVIRDMPTLLVGVVIFLFAFQTLYKWLYINARGFTRSDYAIVWIILGTVIFVGFMQGILVGIVLTVLLFVIRYSMISAIESRHTLQNLRSSVERSHSSNEILMQEGSSVIIYSLRGFLFFGSANAILDTIIENEQLENDKCKVILMDMRRVTGLDVSAMKTFSQIKVLCDKHDMELMYSGISPQLGKKLATVNAVTVLKGKPLVFNELDYAMEHLEDECLDRRDIKFTALTIKDILTQVITDENKVNLLLNAMDRVECKAGDQLFAQGDPDAGFYLVERGSLSAFINTDNNKARRIRKFSPGSLIGELSNYLPIKLRSATIIADEDAVLYHLSLSNRASLDNEDHELRACIHELVATTLAERVNFMNVRLMSNVD